MKDVPSAVEWQSRRSAYNHDWLQNRLMQVLGSGLDFLKDKFKEAGFAERFTERLRDQWSRHRGEATRLVAEFERDLSPRNRLGLPPLSRFDRTTCDWLSVVVHECWLARDGKRQLLDDIRDAETQADEAFGRVEPLLEALSTGRDSAMTLSCLEAFDRSCRALSKAISRLPSRIEVI